jgi:hypothetical protein
MARGGGFGPSQRRMGINLLHNTGQGVGLPTLRLSTVRRFLPALLQHHNVLPSAASILETLLDNSEIVRRRLVPPADYVEAIRLLFHILQESERSSSRYPLLDFLEREWRRNGHRESFVGPFATDIAAFGDMLRGGVLGGRDSLSLDLELFVTQHAEEIAESFPLDVTLLFIESLSYPRDITDLVDRVFRNLPFEGRALLEESGGHIRAAILNRPSRAVIEYLCRRRQRAVHDHHGDSHGRGPGRWRPHPHQNDLLFREPNFFDFDPEIEDLPRSEGSYFDPPYSPPGPRGLGGRWH